MPKGHPLVVEVDVEDGRVVDCRIEATPAFCDPVSALPQVERAVVGVDATIGFELLEGLVERSLDGHGELAPYAARRLARLVRNAQEPCRQPRGWRFVAPTAELARLGDPAADTTTGLEPDLRRWEDHTWVLHMIHLNKRLAVFGSSQALEDARREAGLLEPTMINGHELEAMTTATGIVLGWSDPPGPGWLRARWSELVDLDAPHDVPPCYVWLDGFYDRADFDGANEGSLDETSWRALAGILAGHLEGGFDGEVVGLTCALMGRLDPWGPRVRRGPLGTWGDLVRPPCEEQFLPNNIWPDDLSWMTWTDHDLSGTLVAGSRELVDAIRAHPDLETVEWERPSP